MPVLSTLAKLIGAFLILYISGASATPTSHFTPRNSLLVPRVPAQHGLGGTSVKQYLFNGHVITNEVYSSCPPKTVCASTLDTDGDPTIQCESVESPGKKEDPKPGTKSPQIGSSNLVTAVTSLKPTQFDIPVTVAADMHATVTAYVLSEDQTFAVKPINIIVGNLRGKDLKVCAGVQSDVAKARECYPNGTYDFKRGDIIDFTWGLTSDQAGALQWGILPV